MELFDELIEKKYGQFFLMTAPTSWGKTSLILSLFSRSRRPWLFLSPLKAIAVEFFQRAKAIYGEEKVFFGRSILQEGTLTVATVEMWREIHRLDVIVVLDEFHLFHLWGYSFRPLLMEKLEELGANQITVLALTATWGKNLDNEWKPLVLQNWDEYWCFNVGQGPKNMPLSRWRLPRFFSSYLVIILQFLSRKKRILVFCQYRNEVEQLTKQLQKRKISALSCVGGRSEFFMQELKNTSDPQIIVATKVLSHGVNLPAIDWIVMTYEEKEEEFYWQMLGRAGRNGETYKLLQFKDFL